MKFTTAYLNKDVTISEVVEPIAPYQQTTTHNERDVGLRVEVSGPVGNGAYL